MSFSISRLFDTLVSFAFVGLALTATGATAILGL